MNKREIKFRVWDGEQFLKKKDPSGYFYENPSSPNGVLTDIAALLRYSSHFGYVIQQFTGIKDVNKREIYEGDIVNVNGGNHIIEWRGAGFAATWSDYNLDTCWFVGGGPVVIGNIFENPELAEKARKGPRE